MFMYGQKTICEVSTYFLIISSLTNLTGSNSGGLWIPWRPQPFLYGQVCFLFLIFLLLLSSSSSPLFSSSSSISQLALLLVLDVYERPLVLNGRSILSQTWSLPWRRMKPVLSLSSRPRPNLTIEWGSRRVGGWTYISWHFVVWS